MGQTTSSEPASIQERLYAILDSRLSPAEGANETPSDAKAWQRRIASMDTSQLKHCALELKIFIVSHNINRDTYPEMNSLILDVQAELENTLRGRPLHEQFPEIAGLARIVEANATHIASLLQSDDKSGKTYQDLEGWQKNHDYALEVAITQTVHAHEQSLGNEPGEILRVYKRGTIWNSSASKPRCQVDGLFQRKDGTWILCESKTHLTMEELARAETTASSFEGYVREIGIVEVPNDYEGEDNASYWMQVSQFKKLHRTDRVVKYLGYNSCERRKVEADDPIVQARKRGFTIVSPTRLYCRT